MNHSVHVFRDNSNIFIPAKFVASRKDGSYSESVVRIQFENLYQLARAGRRVGGAICVGSVPPDLRAVWERLRGTGITIELYERGAASGTEQGVDQCLQVHMLRVLADIRPPGVAVLMTGDGAGYDAGAGYHADLERLHKAGWRIEVLAWDAACRKALKTWAQSVGVYVSLDDYYDNTTLLEGGRRATPISLRHRAKAVPNP